MAGSQLAARMLLGRYLQTNPPKTWAPLFAPVFLAALTTCEAGSNPNAEVALERQETSVSPNLRPTAEAAPSPAASTTASPSPVPPWAQGEWTGAGTAVRSALELPGNQGVQLAWLKDDGKSHTGPLRLSLTFAEDGRAEGRLEGALGVLLVFGSWQGAPVLPLELRAPEEGLEVFHGTLTIVWNEADRRGKATVFATSGDGRWLRTATLDLSRGV